MTERLACQATHTLVSLPDALMYPASTGHPGYGAQEEMGVRGGTDSGTDSQSRKVWAGGLLTGGEGEMGNPGEVQPKLRDRRAQA